MRTVLSRARTAGTRTRTRLPGAHDAHPEAPMCALLGAQQGVWPHDAVPGGVRIKTEPVSPELRVPKQQPELPPLPAEYANLQAEDGDLDEPGYLRALHQSEAYQP
ncbi:hypothetical protein ZWY2020_050274 [Hordeum vulgare]|nr:hypothetical protein ZWY2020_050274 [Hordeum vulgare]